MPCWVPRPLAAAASCWAARPWGAAAAAAPLPATRPRRRSRSRASGERECCAAAAVRPKAVGLLCCLQWGWTPLNLPPTPPHPPYCPPPPPPHSQVCARGAACRPPQVAVLHPDRGVGPGGAGQARRLCQRAHHAASGAGCRCLHIFLREGGADSGAEAAAAAARAALPGAAPAPQRQAGSPWRERSAAAAAAAAGAATA